MGATLDDGQGAKMNPHPTELSPTRYGLDKHYFTLALHPDMNPELDILQRVYERLGCYVERYPARSTDAVFHRDVCAWTPYGHIRCNMGKETRRWEPRVWEEVFGIQPTFTLASDLKFEGADLMWLDAKTCVGAFGSRTNREGIEAVFELMAVEGAQCYMMPLPWWHDQHLLGVANCIGKTIFAVGDEATLDGRRIPLPTEEYILKCTNWVYVPATGGGSVVINEECEKTIKILEQYATVIPVPIKSLLCHGGGVACATGIKNYAF